MKLNKNKLLLTSTGLEYPIIKKEFLKLIGKITNKTKIVIICLPRTEEEKSYVDASKKEILELGIIKKNLKILDLNKRVKYDELKGFNAMYFCGGNTFYILKKVKEAGFDDVIKKFIEDGKVYIGISAGSIIIGPNIEIAGIGDKNDVNLKDLNGLKIIDKAISPHFCDKEREEVEKFKKKVDYPIITLTDKQALLIEGDKERIIE